MLDPALKRCLTRLKSFLVKSPILMPQESVCESGDKRYHGWHARWNNESVKGTTFINVTGIEDEQWTSPELLQAFMYCCEKGNKDISMNSSRRQKEIPVGPGKT